MPISYDIDKKARVLHFMAEGKTVPSDWDRFLENVQKDPDFESGMNFLIDVRLHESVAPSKFFWDVSRVVPTDGTSRGVRWALIISRDVSKGLSMMMSTLVKNAGIEVRAFRDETKARKWISKTREQG